MTSASRRRWFRFSLRTMFAGVTIVALLVWIGYPLNWIRQRRALLAEGEVVFQVAGPLATGGMSDRLPPTGSTLSQRLLALYGEPAVKQVIVYYVVDPETDVDVRDGLEYPKETTAYPKVQRAQRLFPEAEIVAVWVERRWLPGYPGLEGAISE